MFYIFYIYICISVHWSNKHRQMHTHALLKHDLINTVYNSHMFQSSKGNLLTYFVDSAAERYQYNSPFRAETCRSYIQC
jgi:hypothetical protein